MSHIRKKWAVLAAVLVMGTVMTMSGCYGQKQHSYTIYDAFDTVTKLQFYAADSEADRIYEAFEAELFRYHALFDIYNDYEGVNNVRTINAQAGIAPVAVDKALIDVLEIGQQIYDYSDGSTNIAMGSVLSIWHEYRIQGMEDPENAELPPMDMLEAAAGHTDMHQVIIDAANGTVYLADRDMSLDLGAIAKGYAAQKLAQFLEDAGVTQGLLDLGGTIVAIGKKPDGSQWQVALQNPDLASEETYIHVLGLENMSVVTSGDYQRYYTVDGTAYHHIIDPDTLMPSDYFSSVSVISDDAGMADALSTALFSMDEAEGRAMLESMDHVHVLWVYKDGRQSMTEGFKDFIR